jgi:hypothetical protein
MTINLNFNLETWIKNLEINAESEEAAIEKLKSMSLADILEEGASVDSEMTFTEIETSIVDYDLEVEVTDIEYAPDPETMGGMSVIEYLKNLLPKRQVIKLRGVTDNDNVEELIKDYIFDETGYDTKFFKFQILGKS